MIIHYYVDDNHFKTLYIDSNLYQLIVNNFHDLMDNN